MKKSRGVLFVDNGIELYHKELFDLALASYKKALPLIPFHELGILYYNMGLCHFSKYNYVAAEKLFHKSFFEYGHKGSGYEYSMTLLFNKKLKEGMELYRYRYYGERNSFPDLPIPKVTSIDKCTGKKVLVLNEQGLGDEFLFSRVISELSKVAVYSHYQVYPEMFQLFGAAFKHDNIFFFDERVLNREFVSGFDCYTTTGDLFSDYTINKGFGHTKLEVILKYSSESINQWIDKTRKNIGVVTSANVLSKNHKARSIDPVSIMGKVTGDYCVHNLQKGNVSEWMVNHEIEDFYDTYDIIRQLDFVITVDTSIVHLCGAMDKKCYMVYDKYLDWRWNFPFYESIEIININDIGKV